ncbi:MAG: non-canonical purine NTP diphosphatase [Flavobacteriaceae bacterium]|nr:non-canonical purine NTP diphosphatase [Flavobacteriaceae bacterium]
MKLVFATNNKNKVKEIKALLQGHFEILTLSDIGCTEEIEETESTIEGNAKLKADYITNNYGYDCFADDTGLEVNALNGAPGVYSARYAGENVTYEDNVQKMLFEMKGKSDRKARFRTSVALNLKGHQYLFDGVCKGVITHSKHGTDGFGYDPIFRPDGFEQTFAEMSLDQKGKISHRGLAMKKLIDFLQEKK